jgi:solute carrier family 45 protein 1/2/4
MQPLVGVLSDLSISKYRRRRYILIGLAILIPSTLLLSTSTATSSVLVDIFRTGLADWDPRRQEAVEEVDKLVAVISIVFMYLSINMIQPASRALILDSAPLSQHSRANAWSGRMTHLGNIGGYAAGMTDLSSWKAVAWIGGGQFRKCGILSLIGAAICSLITCVGIKEESREDFEGSVAEGIIAKIREAVYHIWQTMRRLPRPVRRICLVQLFAFAAWFPFLVYASEWVIELQQRESNKMGDGDIDDKDAEKGSFALL